MVSHALQRFDLEQITTVPVRAEVHDFAQAMEEQLLLNDHKGGWREAEIAWLIQRARGELDELLDAVLTGQPVDVVLAEAADVGNFAMMVADVYAHDQVDHEPAEATPAAAPAPAAAVEATIRALVDLPPFVDGAGRNLQLKAGDVALVSAGIAQLLLRRNKAVLIEVAA